jgi:thioredoxin-dependent peroxiredoxin
MAHITIGGNPIHTIGNLPEKGSKAPAFKLVKSDLSLLSSEELSGRKVLLNIFPSIGTSVCAAALRQFNKIAGELDNTVVVCVSKDLPFASHGFCAAEGLDNVVTGSDFRSGSFGEDYGVTMLEGPFEGLLSRSVVILNEDWEVIYTEQVPEIGQEPDYEAALKALK